MSLEELWQLFPIFLQSPQDDWELWYKQEEEFLKSLLPDLPGLKIHHVGSTSIPGIWAKPIVDVLIEATHVQDLPAIKNRLEENGYLCMSQSRDRVSLNKGYSENGFEEKVFHIHLCLQGDNDEILFRDYLRSHHPEALEYEKLKMTLWKQFEYDRDGYTDGKTDFVKKILHKAGKEKLEK